MHTQFMIMAENYKNYTKAPIMSAPNETSCFEVSDFFEFNDWIEEEEEDPILYSSMPLPAGYNNPQFNPNFTQNEIVINSSTGISNTSNLNQGTINNRDSGVGRKEMREKVAFKTKSEVEVLDDGFKWRKYGKKMVKNSPNPRNYYRCSFEGCPVKKRVERDKEDQRYVVTTYEGIHNHQGPQL